jgi:hypothetical protein
VGVVAGLFVQLDYLAPEVFWKNDYLRKFMLVRGVASLGPLCKVAIELVKGVLVAVVEEKGQQ